MDFLTESVTLTVQVISIWALVYSYFWFIPTFHFKSTNCLYIQSEVELGGASLIGK
jgi:hypothetical protein